MIKAMKPLSLAETEKIIKDSGGNETVSDYFKKFVKLKYSDSEKMRKELEDLNNHKIKDDHITKIIDFLPEDASDINKIFTDVSLDDGEIKQIIDIVAKYR